MGPAATVDFLDKLTKLTPAACDQDHLPVLTFSDPTLPDRSAAIEGRGESPELRLIAGIRLLEAAGAKAIAIPCNTAHYWHTVMTDASSVPVLSTIDATVEAVARNVAVTSRIGVLATEGTILARLYQRPLIEAGFIAEALTPSLRAQFCDAGLRKVKEGKIDEARHLLTHALQEFHRAGCRHVILGCTEASVVAGLETTACGVELIDSNLSLARKALRHLGREPIEFREISVDA